MQEISIESTKQVNGGFGPAGAGFGAIVGAAGYLGGAATSGNFSWGGLASATAGGAISGAVGGPVGSTIARYVLPRVSFATGAATGAQ